MKISNKIYWVFLFVVLIALNKVEAHSALTASSPENGAVLNEAPTTLELKFKGQVKLVKVILSGDNIDESKLSVEPDKGFDNNFTLTLPSLTSGKYTISWMVMGADTHKITGEISFNVKL